MGVEGEGGCISRSSCSMQSFKASSRTERASGAANLLDFLPLSSPSPPSVAARMFNVTCIAIGLRKKANSFSAGTHSMSASRRSKRSSCRPRNWMFLASNALSSFADSGSSIKSSSRWSRS